MKIYDREKYLDDYGKSNYVNNIKMILIFLVVIGHMLTGIRTGDVVARTIYNSIYLFHMPAFIMVTGYLSRGAINNKAKLKKSIISYIVIYLYAQIVYDILQRMALPKGQTFDFSILTPRYALWFMYVLIVWLPVAYLIKRGEKYKLTMLMVVMALVAGLVTDIGTEYSLSRIFVFFPYFLLGYYLDLERVKEIKSEWYTVFAVILLILNGVVHYFARGKIYAIWYTGSMSYTEMGQGNIEGLWIRFLYMLSALVITLALFRVIPRGEFIFSYIGGRTLQIYLIHAIICRMFYIRETLVPLKQATNVWVVILLGILFTIVLSNKKLSDLVEWPLKLLYNKKNG